MITNDIGIYLILVVLSFLNILVPVSGSATVTPILALLTDTHRAIGIATFYFFLSSIIRVFIFYKDIKWDEIKKLLPFSIVFAIIGAFSLIAITPVYLIIIVFVFTLVFIFKKIKSLFVVDAKKKYNKAFGWLIGSISGFLQGVGVGGSDLRNGYLYAHELTISQVHGTTALIGSINFLLATFIRLKTDQLVLSDLTVLLYLFPFILLGIVLGRKIIYKINKKLSDYIVLLVMIVTVILLGIKIFQLV